MDKLYKVLRIDELSKLSETGGIVKVYRHQIKTKGGVVLTVEIEEKDFTPEKVDEILTKKAQNADKILAL